MPNSHTNVFQKVLAKIAYPSFYIKIYSKINQMTLEYSVSTTSLIKILMIKSNHIQLPFMCQILKDFLR